MKPARIVFNEMPDYVITEDMVLLRLDMLAWIKDGDDIAGMLHWLTGKEDGIIETLEFIDTVAMMVPHKDKEPFMNEWNFTHFIGIGRTVVENRRAIVSMAKVVVPDTSDTINTMLRYGVSLDEHEVERQRKLVKFTLNTGIQGPAIIVRPDPVNSMPL